MEAAAFVLTVYPAVVLAFEQYKKGAKYFDNWYRFRRKYENFTLDIWAQKLFFEGILQDLMCGGPDPFLAGINSKDTFLRTVNNESFTGWNDPKLEKSVKIRLGNRYDWCIQTIQRIHHILKALEKLLVIQEVYILLFGDFQAAFQTQLF
jgi:hypothetical protein